MTKKQSIIVVYISVVFMILFCIAATFVVQYNIQQREQMAEKEKEEQKEINEKFARVQLKFNVGQRVKSIASGEYGQVLSAEKSLVKTGNLYMVRFASDLSRIVRMHEFELAAE